MSRVSLGLRTLRSAMAVSAIALLAPSWLSAQTDPTAEDYVRKVGGEARIVPAGTLVIDGQKVACGARPTVLTGKLDDYGGAHPTFLILNPKLLARVNSTPVKLWIFAHECGHQFRGPDEEAADCFAVRRGRRQGWLTPQGLEEVRAFMAPTKGDSAHFSGASRCAAMRKCYADPR